MDSKEQQLMELLGLTARSLTHLTASVTSMSFELLRSDVAAGSNDARWLRERQRSEQLLAEVSRQAAMRFRGQAV